MSPVPSSAIWQQLHWSFFVDVQGLILCLSRFEKFLAGEKLELAATELMTAAKLMRASGAAMVLAGNFPREDYENEVRPSMQPPSVASDNFSGLMSWDHSVLIQTWQRLQPKFRALPEELMEAHKDFVAAYKTLATSHSAVCSRFGGSEGGSLRNPKEAAVDALERFRRSRTALIDPAQSHKENA